MATFLVIFMQHFLVLADRGRFNGTHPTHGYGPVNCRCFVMTVETGQLNQHLTAGQSSEKFMLTG